MRHKELRVAVANADTDVDYAQNLSQSDRPICLRRAWKTRLDECHASRTGHMPERNVRECTRKVRTRARSHSRASRSHNGFLAICGQKCFV